MNHKLIDLLDKADEQNREGDIDLLATRLSSSKFSFSSLTAPTSWLFVKVQSL